mmetsp:Transcript_29530/g.85980  ORF Transcript_29530/g.85980 Transcript_29530/m.85980 type:complete len:597 (-) Transcript_29530:2500-4290(-)
MRKATFILSIRLDKAKNLHNLLPEDVLVAEAWLSYRLLGAAAPVVQSADTFELYSTSTEGFESCEDVFELELSAPTALATSSFDVYLCTHGSVLGKTRVKIESLLALNEGGDQFAERAGRGTFYFTTAANGKEDDESSAPSSIEVGMSLRRELNDGIAAGISGISSSSKTCKREASTTTTSYQISSSPNKPAIAQHSTDASAPTSALAPAAPLLVQTQTPSTTGTTADDRIEFEKERRRWEEWRHKEELKWHNKMREQESAALKALDEQSKTQERQNDKEIETRKKEFESLEGRLRKALAEVEKRERRIRTVEASREAEYTTKMAEVELKQKLLKEETKHAAELEKVKVMASNERAVTAEKAKAIAEERTTAIELNFEAFKKAHRESHEGSLQKEISTLRGELVAAESRINKAIQEKNEAIFEKEQHRANVHKLAKALKREKAKVQSIEDKEREQFVLEKKRHCLEISNNREELKRITSQLQGLDGNAGAAIATDADASAGKNSSINSNIPARAAPTNSMPPQKPRMIGPVPAPLTPPRHPLTKSAAILSKGDSLGAVALGAHVSSQTPPTKVWNGVTIETTRHVASDSKLHFLRR